MENLKWNGVDEKTAVKLFNLSTKETAIEIVKTIVLPTIGSEADICFWNDVISHLNKL
jgi:hypothetical protein